MSQTEINDNRWYIDKRVPVSVIITLLFQFAGIIWLMSRLESRIMSMEQAYLAQAIRDERQDRAFENGLNLIREDIRSHNQRFDRWIEIHQQIPSK